MAPYFHATKLTWHKFPILLYIDDDAGISQTYWTEKSNGGDIVANEIKWYLIFRNLKSLPKQPLSISQQ